jgi:hypothetical protein
VRRKLRIGEFGSILSEKLKFLQEKSVVKIILAPAESGFQNGVVLQRCKEYLGGLNRRFPQISMITLIICVLVERVDLTPFLYRPQKNPTLWGVVQTSYPCFCVKEEMLKYDII